MKDQLTSLLNKPMDRKEFLKHVGMGFAILVGFSGVIKALKSSTVTAQGYGSSVYGGRKNGI
jgi:hypothetical protein